MPQIVSTADFCRNFPKSPAKRLPRDNLFEHIDAVFREAARCVLIDGSAQSGKTELLAGYMKRHPQHSVGVFLSPGDTYFYSPEYARIVLAEQICWILNGHAGNYDSLDEATYKGLLWRLQKTAKQTPITFVVDGLAEKGTPEHRLRNEILGLFPFSQPEFRFLVSGSTDVEEDLRPRCKAYKSVPLIPIAQEEASEFFSDLSDLTPKDISDIRKFCGGSIGRMTMLKAVIESKRATLDEVLSNKSGDLEDLMEMEWSLLAKNDMHCRLLAYLCFANQPLHIDLAASLSGSGLTEVRDFSARSAFIDFDIASDAVSIDSAPQKNFLQVKLAQYEPEVQAGFLKQLLENPESTNSDRHLPAQLMQVGKYDDLIKRLDVRHFCRLLNSEKSLRAIRANLDLGLKAARALKDEGAAARFSMGKSVVGGVNLSVGSQSRIEALVTMGQIDGAIELSLAAPTDEERLKHLAATAKALFDERKAVPNSIREEIRNLLDQLHIDALGSMAAGIACDLIAVDLEAAVELFNKASAATKPDKPHVVPVNHEGHGERPPEDSPAASGKNIQVRMSERHHRRFAQALGQMVDRTSPEKICARVRQSSDTASDLVFLKEWIGRRRSEPGASDVANVALDAILKDLSRSPRIEDLRAIAVVLPYIKDLSEAEKLSKRIQALVSTDLFLGNSVEAVRLKMLLAETQYRLAPNEAEMELVDILLEAEALDDLSLRVACLSWALHALKQFEGSEKLEKETALISYTAEKLMNSIESLLKNSADHFSAVKTALPALARADVGLALKVCASLNTEVRRDQAYVLLASELFALMLYTGNPSSILASVNGIVDEHSRSNAILTGLNMVVSHLKAKRTTACNEAVVSLWKRLRMANFRFIGLRHSLHIALLTSQPTNKLSIIREELDKCWKAIDIDWARWELGYALVRDTYSCDQQFAAQWLNKVTDEESTTRAPSESVSDVLKLTASLAVRAYSYLAPNEFLETEEFSKLANLIGAVAVPDERLLLWCELGIRLHYCGKAGFSNYICRTFVEPMLPNSSANYDENAFSNALTLAHAAPFVFITHESTGQFAVEKIECPSQRDAAISQICGTLLRKVAPTDAYKDPDSDGYEIDAQTAASVIGLMRKISTDWAFFNVLESLTHSLSARKNDRRLRRTQVADFLNTLEDLANLVLPDQRNIKHRGFQISSLALINRSRQAAGFQVTTKTWAKLFDDARGLSNVSDRAVVTAFVAVGARGKQGVIPENWLDQIRSDIAAAPTVIDRIDRYAWVAEILEGFDKKQSIAFARLGMTLTKNVGPDVDILERKRKLLDIVYNIDPDLAENFIELADGDRARKNDKAALESRIKLKRLQKEVASDPDKLELIDESDADVAELSMRNLAALNANRIVPKAMDDFAKLSARAQRLPFESAYSAWSWMVENAIRKGGPQSKGEKTVTNAFNAALSAGELIISLLHGEANGLNPGGFSRAGLIKPGGRDEALITILSWAANVDGQSIFITDPYFGPDDLELLFEIAKAAPKSPLRVLTGRRTLHSAIPDGNFESAFADAWRSVCDAGAAEIEICIIGVNSDGDHPIHERWMLALDNGLRLGTSAKSLGNFRVSELTRIESDELKERRALVGDFLDRKTRTWQGNRVTLSSFDLL